MQNARSKFSSQLLTFHCNPRPEDMAATLFAAASWLTLVLAQSDVGARNLELVDPFIGSVDGGNVFVGASLPYGSKLHNT